MRQSPFFLLTASEAFNRASARLILLPAAMALTVFLTMAAAAQEAGAAATEYHVGPGQKYTKVVDVPWETLNPGDCVYIHWRSAEDGGDYHEKINLTRSGTADKPIRIIGLAGPNGERPCLNGKDAVTRTVDPENNSTYYAGNQERGMLCFSGRNKGDWQTAGANHWDVSGLKITGARPANDFTDSFGKLCNYQRSQGGLGSAGAGVFIDRGNYLRFSDMELTDNNNGFFGSSDNYGSEARHVHDVILEDSLLYGNGAPNNASVHNAYVEVANWTVRNNYFGPLVAESGGSHIKDRGANVVIEGNLFDGSAVPLFLDPPENSMGWMEFQPGFERITVRNNVLRKSDDLPVNSMDIIITGFDVYGDIQTVRTVDISHNTFVICASRQRNWSFNVLDLIPRPQVIEWNDNVFLRYVEGKDATPSGICFVAKISPVDEKTIIDIGPNNYISAQDPLDRQKEGNGTATIKGWEKLNLLPDMTLSQLEEKFGINLHDPKAADFGRFDAETNAWYKEHKAGASSILEKPIMPSTTPTAAPAAGNEGPGQVPQSQVTIKGNVLCERACIAVPWDQTSQDASHIPVIFAFEGTAEVAAQLDEIMDKYYPEKGLDVEEAQKFLDEFSLRLKYYISAGPLTDKIHKDVEWGSQILALTGGLSEKDGRKWIAVTKYEPTTIAYPARMLAPDKPFVTPDKEPLVLKVSDMVTLKCVPVPAGRFLQGSPFYQQRYQDEFPHEVVLTRPFYMLETPITQEMFEAVTDKNPSVDKGAQLPVEMAAYADITEFCRILSERNGRKVRVPTDAEWEYAARVGTSNPCFTPKYKDQISEAGIKGGSTPVKTMKPNAWGLYDMLCGGWHITSSYKADNARAKEIDPQGPPRGDGSIQTGEAGPMHKSRGGYHYSFIRPNMHGAAGEDGGLWEGGTSIFRVLVEAETRAAE